MKKNKLFSLLAAAALVVTVPSCTNLDERIYDQLPAETFGGTSIEINALVGTVYNQLKRVWAGGDFKSMSECAGSVQIYPTRKGGDWWDGGQYMQMFMHTYTAQTSCNRGAWNNCMSAIGTCNANLSVVEGSTMADKDQKAAEIRGIRAYWYYILCDFYGNVPMVVDYSDKELPECSPRAQVFSWIEGELKAIVAQLPESNHDNYGRFTKGAAYTLLAKMYLNSEAWGLGAKYAEVIPACEEVMKGDYILEPEWKTNFIVKNEVSKEAILSAQFSNQDTSLSLGMHFRTLGYVENKATNGNYSAWNGYCAQPDYVKLFINEDGTQDPRIASFRLGQQYDYSTGEVLMTGHNFPMNHYAEVYPIEGTNRDGTLWREVNQQDGGRVGKWDYEAGLASAMENDYHIFRLADVYLMEAEALLRTGGDQAKALELVNKVRSRAYGDNSHNYTSIDLDKILLERRLELAWEISSRQDDIRFGVYDKDMWSMFRAKTGKEDANGVPEVIDPKAYSWNRPSDKHLLLFPIPTTAWQTNPKLTQNPGYPAFN